MSTLTAVILLALHAAAGMLWPSHPRPGVRTQRHRPPRPNLSSESDAAVTSTAERRPRIDPAASATAAATKVAAPKAETSSSPVRASRPASSSAPPPRRCTVIGKERDHAVGLRPTSRTCCCKAMPVVGRAPGSDRTPTVRFATSGAGAIIDLAMLGSDSAHAGAGQRSPLRRGPASRGSIVAVDLNVIPTASSSTGSRC